MRRQVSPKVPAQALSENGAKADGEENGETRSENMQKLIQIVQNQIRKINNMPAIRPISSPVSSFIAPYSSNV